MKSRWASAGISGIGLALLYLPLLAVTALSLNRSKLGVSWQGFTLGWYARAWNNPAVTQALWNTLILAAVSTIIATVLGTMLAIGISRYPWPRGAQRGFMALLHL